MQIVERFVYTGRSQKWQVPKGVTSATFECWGAGGGMSTQLTWYGKVKEVRGGSGPTNNDFTNHPDNDVNLMKTFSNNAGYAKGVKATVEGEVYTINVGGNGGPGFSTIRLNASGTYTVGLRGGAGGWNGGGDGGKGGHVYQNLYNSTVTHMQYSRASAPASAKVNQLWYDTDAHLVKKCNATYSGGNSSGKWDTVTASHGHLVGPSAGGGGGATDVRLNGEDLTDRVLVAGGSGGGGGHYRPDGPAKMTFREVPATPAPPFGRDSLASGATGPDHTWIAAINYIVGTFGVGGMGGSANPTPAGTRTADDGVATSGGSGGMATARHAEGVEPSTRTGSEGHGGGATAGGNRGAGGANGTAGALGQGGVGADADGGYDDWCAGGGGGGGGYYGGGGGGMGFKTSGTGGTTWTHGGGGGGGSNYVSSIFTGRVLSGCARPPASTSSYGSGANGLGGFARITYNLGPSVIWTSVPVAVEGGTEFDATFEYSPAMENGAKIAHYVVGTGSATDTFPTSETTIMVPDSSVTSFTRTFTAPASGSSSAIFVEVVDADGDSSGWLKQVVTGLTATEVSTATITSPSAGDQFIDSQTVTWTTGSQTPLVAYRLGVSGTDSVTGAARETTTGWHRGGSRVNLALDPGFQGSAVWSSPLAPSTDYPGVSGSCGKIVWPFTTDGSAGVQTTSWDNLIPDLPYVLHLDVASALANDIRYYVLSVKDDDGTLAAASFDLEAEAAGSYVTVDLPFTPHTQSVYVTLAPSATGTFADPLVSLDFEDATTGGFTGSVASDGAQSLSGDLSLKATGAASLDPSAMLSVAGDFLLTGWVYTPSASATDGTLQVSGTGVQNGPLSASTPTRNAWAEIRLPFTWDGTGTVTVDLAGNSGGIWYDDIEIYLADNANWAEYGNTDNGQTTYLANMLLEMAYVEDGDDGYGTYFDGSHLNGNTGTVSWDGTAHASASFLKGTDVTTGSVSLPDTHLDSGELFLDTLAENALVSGYSGSRTTLDMAVNPSLPATPTVTLTITEVMTLTVNAADAGATYKTVSFDIFRNGVRIATGLVPDDTTREAVYVDAPGHGVAVTYMVRAVDSEGGYADQTDGTVE